MPGLTQTTGLQQEQTAGLSSFPAVWSAILDEHVLDVRWSSDGKLIAAMPSDGEIAVFDSEGRRMASLSEHRGGNGSCGWHPKEPTLFTYGQDGELRIWRPPFSAPAMRIVAGRGWCEQAAFNADGTLLAAAVDRELLVFEVDSAAGELRDKQRFGGHKSTLCHFVWNPAAPLELAAVGDGGAVMWRVGSAAPFSRFDWGGASLTATWSPDGRWLVTGDQTPSVHVFDFRTGAPLHIQGYGAKVKNLAWQGQGEWLATGGGESIAVWPCTGEKGPDGATPLELSGHPGSVTALDFCPESAVLASGCKSGFVLLWMPHQSNLPALVAQRLEEITVLRWSSDRRSLAVADAGGGLTVFQLKA
jgi:WD40 repeat protein